MKKTLSAISVALCLALAALPVRAAEPESAYDTIVAVQGTAVEELQTKLNALSNGAGNVLVTIEKSLSSFAEELDLFIPTDKGIDSLTLALAHEGGETAAIRTRGTVLNFFANGIPLIIGKGINFGKLPSEYASVDVRVFGGSRDAAVESTSITVNAGGAITGLIFGGGYHGDVNGGTSITVYGGYGGIFGGGFVYPEKENAVSHTADVSGKAVILVSSTVEPKSSHETRLNGSIYGGGYISAPGWSSTPDLPENCRLSAQVKGGVSIYADCLVSSANIQGGGYIVCPRGGGAGSALNANVTGRVDITLGAGMRQAEEFAAGRYSCIVAGGGKIDATGNVPSVSARILGDVAITAVEDFAAANGAGGIGTILGGGIVSGEGPAYDATVNGSVSITTSRKAPLLRTGSVVGRLGVVGGGYASYGTANVTGDVSIRICKAPDQAENCQNVKNLVGGGVAGQNGIAQVQGRVEIVVEDDIAFEGGWFQAILDSEKLGITGGGWVTGYGGSADVKKTVSITVGKGAVFGTEESNALRVIGGGKIERPYTGSQGGGRPAPSAGTGDVSVTLKGTVNLLDELFCGSFEGRSPSASAVVTLQDSSVGYLYDKDICEKPVTVTFLGRNQLGAAWMDGSDKGPVKDCAFHIGDGTASTNVETANYLYSYHGTMDIHIFPNASLKKESGDTLFYNARNLTIDEGGTLGICYDESIGGSLAGGGMLELLAADKRLQMLESGASFSGTVKVKATEPHANQVVATTAKAGTLGAFVYHGEGFSIQKVENGDNYDWTLAIVLLPPELTPPTVASGLVYTGEPQHLVSGGSVEGGVLLYSLDGAPYGEAVPAAVDAGEYKVCYMVQGDDAHSGLDPRCFFVTIDKAPQSPPAAPELESRTNTSVTLKAIAPNSNGAAARYSKDSGATWQSSPVFTGLTAGTSCSFVAQYSETENYLESQAGAALRVSLGGGVSHRYYTIAATAGQGGSIAPSGMVSIREGADETFTITPDDGYAVADVLVDGRSAGAVSAYTFQGVSEPHTIEASFQETAESYSRCFQNDTCPIYAFTDANVRAWYHDGVHYCLQNGLMVGFGNGKFGPGEPLTRGMLVQTLYNKEGKPVVTSPSPFEDVTTGTWYADAIAWAAEKDIVAGYGNGRYGPRNPITREQLAVILWHYAGSPETAGKLGSFTDGNEASNWAVPALRWAVEQKIVSGKGNGILDPRGNATRAEIAVMLMKYCEKAR